MNDVRSSGGSDSHVDVETAATREDLEAALAAVKGTLRDGIGALQKVGRDAALSVAARIQADTTIAVAALDELRLHPRKRRRQVAEIRRLRRLLNALNRFHPDAASGRVRHLKEVARMARRITRALTEPAE